MFQSSLSKKLRLLRNNLHLRQEDVAKALTMERTTYCNYENGTRTPSLETVVQLADFYQVPIDYLVRESNEQDMNTDLYPLSLSEKAIILLYRELPLSAQQEWTHYFCYRLSLMSKTTT